MLTHFSKDQEEEYPLSTPIQHYLKTLDSAVKKKWYTDWKRYKTVPIHRQHDYLHRKYPPKNVPENQ